MPIVIRGHKGSTNIPPLQAAMSRMMLDTEAKGIPPTLIRRLDFWPTRPPTVYTTLHNPLGVSMDLSGFDSYVRFNDPLRGVVEMTHLKDDVLRVHIEPQQTQRAAMAAEWPSKANTTLGRVNITATSNVLLDGQFSGTVYYAQNNVRIRKMGLPI